MDGKTIEPIDETKNYITDVVFTRVSHSSTGKFRHALSGDNIISNVDSKEDLLYDPPKKSDISLLKDKQTHIFTMEIFLISQKTKSIFQYE